MTDVRLRERRQLAKLLAVFIALIAALATLYLKKPERPVSAASPNVTMPQETRLDAEILIDKKPEKTQDIDIQAWTTPQGMRVLFVEAREVPMLDVRLVFNAGGARDGTMPGLAALTNGMLNEGTGDYDVDAIARHFENLGAQLDLGSYRDMAIVSLRTLSEPEYRDKALPLFYSIAGAPSFPEDALTRNRQQMLLGLEAERQDPHATINRAFYSSLYGDHPYGIPTSGTESSLAAITRDDLVAFHRRHYVAANTVLAMTGAIDRKTAEAIALAADAALPKGNAAPELPAPNSVQTGSQRHLDFPSSQVHILVGALGVARGSDDWAALQVGNEILGGGGFTSRLNQVIRQDNGLAYSVYSGWIPMAARGPFMMGLQTRADNRDKALALLDQTFQTFLTKGPSAEDVRAAQKNILGSLPMSTANNRAIVDQLGMIGFYQLPLDTLKTLPAKIAAVTPEEVRAAFNTYLKDQGLITLTLGGTP